MTRNRHRAATALTAAALLGLLAPLPLLALQPQSAGAPLQPGDTLPVDPAVTVGRLENGLRYYIRANARPENRAELMLVVNAGSVLEDEDQRGLAHFVEHMAFNGTENFPKQALVSYLESIGMRFGADLNAYTSFDETVYTLTVPTDTGTALERGIAILEDWAHAQQLDPEEIEKERGVVIEEWRLGQGAAARMRDQLFPVLFRGSRYAERLPIGDTAVLASFPPEALERYYRDWYRPDLMAVVAVGEFDPAHVEALIRERFSDIAASPNPRERTVHGVPEHEETLVSIATDPEATNSLVQVFYKRPHREERTVGEYRLSLVGRLHDAMLNARFSELAQQPDPPFLGAGASAGAVIRTMDAYILGAASQDGQIERALEAVLTEAERVARHGFTATELERARANLLRGYEVAYAERDRTNSATFAAEYSRAYLQDEPIPGIAFEYEIAKQYVPGVTLDEVNAHARETMSGSPVIAVQAPEKPDVTLPAEDALLALFDAVRAKEIAPYEDRVADAPLVADPPAAGSITAETLHDAIGSTEWTLSNGAKVFVKPTDFKNDEVLFAAFSPGGTSLAPDSVWIDAELATLATAQGGVGGMSAVELGKALAGNTASVYPFIGVREETLSGQASPGDLETMLQLAYLRFTAPRRDTASFQAVLANVRTTLANRDADPRNAFNDTIMVTLAQHHPRRRPITGDDIDGWQLDRSLDFYRDRFADAGDFTFVFVGNVDPAALRPLAEQWLASLPSTGRQETPRDLGIRPPDGVIEKTVRRGLEPKSETRLTFTGPFEFTRENRHVLASLAAVLDVRLRDVLREDLGGTYGVQVSQSTSDDPVPGYTFNIAFGADPDRLEALVETVFAEIDKLATEGPEAETVANVKESQRRSWETSQTENGFWIGQIQFTARTGGDFARIPDYPQLVDALTPAAVQEAARQYLRRDRYVRVSLYPQR